MRLVDWDKVKISYDKQVSGTIAEPVYNINVEAPTVEAIPVEWFKNLIKTVEDSKNYEEYEILKWALNKWENQEKEK